MSRVRQQGPTGPDTFDMLAQFSIFYSNFSQTLLRGSSATCVVFEMFRKRKQRASQAAAAAGAAGVAYAPHTLLELSKQLLLCSKNCTSLSRDTMKHPPVFRDAKSARTPKFCGHIHTRRDTRHEIYSLSHGGAERHLVSAPWRIAAIPKAS